MVVKRCTELQSFVGCGRRCRGVAQNAVRVVGQHLRVDVEGNVVDNIIRSFNLNPSDIFYLLLIRCSSGWYGWFFRWTEQVKVVGLDGNVVVVV